MILSQILMVISLVVLAYMVWIAMSGSGTKSPTPTGNTENFGQPKLKDTPKKSEDFGNFNPINVKSNIPAAPYPAPNPESGDVSDVIINYSIGSNNTNSIKNIAAIKGANDTNIIESNYKKPEGFESQGTGNVFINPPYQSNDNIKGVVDLSNSDINAAAYVPQPEPSGQAPQTEDVNDVYKVDGTDFLSAPLADRFYYTNSIANVNRNASHDFRGDIPTPYNDKLTPFYQSAIYGEPMTINRLSDCTK